MVHVERFDDRMIANNLEPHYLTHPGEVIKDELEARGISQRQLARSIGVPASQLNELLNAKRSLSAEMALLIGQALDLDPAPLLALQTDYNLLSAKRNKSFLERLKDTLPMKYKQRDIVMMYIKRTVTMIHWPAS